MVINIAYDFIIARCSKSYCCSNQSSIREIDRFFTISVYINIVKSDMFILEVYRLCAGCKQWRGCKLEIRLYALSNLDYRPTTAIIHCVVLRLLHYGRKCDENDFWKAPKSDFSYSVVTLVFFFYRPRDLNPWSWRSHNFYEILLNSCRSEGCLSAFSEV